MIHKSFRIFKDLESFRKFKDFLHIIFVIQLCIIICYKVLFIIIKSLYIIKSSFLLLLITINNKSIVLEINKICQESCNFANSYCIYNNFYH